MQGVRIQATIRRTRIYKFQDHIYEDKVYFIHSFSVSFNGGSTKLTSGLEPTLF